MFLSMLNRSLLDIINYFGQVTRENFSRMVLDNDKDVLLMFHAEASDPLFCAPNTRVATARRDKLSIGQSISW